MNRPALIRFAFLALATLPAVAQNSLEIISLRHRTADQVLPSLQPLVEPGGTVSGQGNQLFVRASPANVAEIRRALNGIDTPARRLEISVRFDEALERERREIGAGGSISNRGSNIEIRGQDARMRSAERVDQRVQVLEGARAMIFTGQSRPVRERRYIQTPGGVVSQEITVVQDMTSGFEVVPRLAGSTVQVDVLTSRQAGDGAAHVASSASGRLGQWFELGSMAMSGARDERAIASSPSGAGSETRRVWIRVDELP